MNSRLSDLTCRNLKFRSISHPIYPLTPILGFSGKHEGQFLHDVLMESISRSSVVRPCVKEFPKDNVLYTFYIISPLKDYIIQAQWLKNHACPSPYCKFCSNSLGTSAESHRDSQQHPRVGVSRSFPCMFSASLYADCRLSMHLMFAS